MTISCMFQRLRQELGTGDKDRDHEIILTFFKVLISFITFFCLFISINESRKIPSVIAVIFIEITYPKYV